MAWVRRLTHLIDYSVYLSQLLGASAGADEAAIGGGGMGGGVLEGLGAAAESAALRNLDDFLPAPWRYLHSRHLAKVRAVGGDRCADK